MLGLLGAVLGLCGPFPTPARAVSSLAVAVATPTVGARTQHLISVTTADRIAVDGTLHLTYPTGFDLSAAALGSISGFGDATPLLLVQGQTAVLACAGDSVAAGPLTVQLLNVGNATVSGTFAIEAETREASGTLREGPATSDPFVLLPGPVDATASSVAGGPAAVADGSTAVPIDISLRDAFGNALAGVDSLDIDIAVAGPPVAVQKLSATSLADGSFGALLRATSVGARTVTVNVAGTMLGQTAQVLFVAGPPDAAASSASIEPSAFADLADSAIITVVLRDNWGNPVADVDSAAVGIDVAGSAYRVDKLASASAADGTLLAALRSTRAERKTVSVDVSGAPIGGPLSVEFLAGPPDHLELALAGDDTVTAGMPRGLTLTVRDAFENRVVGFAGSLALSTDTAGPGTNVTWATAGAGTLSPTSPGAAAYGFAPADSGTVVLAVTDTRAEALQLLASGGSLQAQASLTVIPAAPQALVMLAGDEQTATVATPVAQALTVQAIDAYGNAVSGRMVSFLPSGDGTVDVDLTAPGPQLSTVTAADGSARCERWTLGTLAGAQNVAAAADFGDTVTFAATATAGAFTALALEPTGTLDLAAGQSSTVAAVAADAYGNAVQGIEVLLYVADALDGVLRGVGETDSLGIAQQRGTTGADGRVRVQYTAATVAGRSDRIDAVAAGVDGAAVPDLLITAVPASVAAVQLQATATEARAGTPTALPVQLVDVFGNRVPSASALAVLAASTGSGIGFASTPAGPFLAPATFAIDGADTLWWSGGPAGTHTVRARDAASALAPDSTAVTVIGAVEVARLDVSSPPTAAAGATFAMTVEGFDAWDNLAEEAVTAFTVDLVDAADTTLVLPFAPAVGAGALAGGTFTTALQRVDRAGSMRIRASAEGRGYLGPLLTVLPGPPWEMAAVGPDTLWGVVAGEAVDAGIEVRDAYGNPVPGVDVGVALVENGVLETPPSPTGPDGRSVARVRTSTTVGTTRVRLSILDGTPAALETWTLVVVTRSGPLAALRASTAAGQLVAGDALAAEVVAVDAFGNPVPDATQMVQLEALGAGAWVQPALGALAGGRLAVALHDTTTGSTRLAARLQAAPAVADTSAAVAVGPAALFRIAAVTDTILFAPAASDTALQARVSDRYGNPIPGATVRVELLSGPPGASLFDGVPPGDDGLTLSDGEGIASAELTLSALVGGHVARMSILDRNPGTLESVAWHVTSTAGAPDLLALAAPPGPWTTGVSQVLGIELRDAAGNRVPVASSVTVVLSQPDAVVAPNPVALVAGVGSCQVTAFTAGGLTASATLDGQPAVLGQLSPRSIVPAAPAGIIAVPVVDPPLNTANGMAVTRLVAGPVYDAWSNVVAAGTWVTVAADRGLLLSEDADPVTAGLQRATDAAGQVEVRLAAPVTAAVANVTFSAGTATGSALAAFEDPAALAYDGALAPTVVAPGATVAFALRLRNLGQADAQLASAGTTFELEDGTGTTYVAPLASDVLVPAGGAAVLSFAPTVLPAGFRPGPRRPLVRAGGLDEHGQPVMGWVALPDGALAVTALAALATTITPVEALVGDTVAVDVTLRNTGAADVQITALDLTPLPAGDFPVVEAAPLPAIAPGGQWVHRTRLQVGAATLPGTYGFEARVMAESGGVTFAAAPDTAAVPLRVVRDGTLQGVAGSVAPARLVWGSSITLAARVRNAGGATVSIDPAQSVARIGTGPAAWTGALVQPEALAGGAEVELRFGPAMVDPLLPAGAHDVVLQLHGSEAGRAFTDTLAFAAAVVVEAPAQIELDAPPVSPAVASLGGQVRFTARVVNAGSATVALDPLATQLRLGEPGASRVSAGLDPLGSTAVPAGATSLSLLPLDLPLDLQLGVPPAVLELRGTQNGLPFALDLAVPAGALAVQQPAALQIVSTTPSQSAISAGQTRSWSAAVAVRNNGQAELSVDPDPARTRLDLLLDGAAAAGYAVQVRGVLAGGDLLLGAGETDSLLFDVTASGSVPGTLALLPVVEAQDINSQARLTDTASDGGFGAVVVQAPATLASLRLRSWPDSLTAGRTQPWSARLVVTNPGGSDLKLLTTPGSTRLTAATAAGPWPLSAALPSPAFLGSGDDRLAAGATDSLAFDLAGVPVVPGPLQLTAVLAALETNSGRSVVDSARADAAVLRPPLVALTGLSGRSSAALVAPAPGRIEVIVGGQAQLDVRLANRGSGVADTLRLRLDTDSGRVSRPEAVASLRDTVVLHLPVAAAPAPAVEWLRATLLGAYDRWAAGAAALDPSAVRDSILLVTLQPAALLAESLQPRDLALQPISQITAGQTLDFLVDVAVHNPGASPALLAAPAARDLQVLLSGQPQNDYVVTPPAALLGRGDLLLPPGARDALRFTVERAGAGEGPALLRATVAGQDGIGGQALAAQAEGPLDVQTAAGLRIARTQALNPRAPDPRVDAGQAIRARVVLINSGQETIDALTVGIAGADPMPSTGSSATLAHLAAGATDSLDLDVTVTTRLGPETLTARVLSAISANTGQPVLELAPIDDSASLWVQRPVSLAFAVTVPGSADPLRAAVTPGQLVTLRIALDRALPSDQQGDWLPVAVDLTQLAPFALEPPVSLPLSLEMAKPLQDLTLRVPAQTGTFSVTAQLASDRLDANDPLRAVLTTPPAASVRLDVGGGADFTACALALSSPAGAVDGTLSAGQLFVVQGLAQAPPNLQQRALRLLVPAGMALPGGDPLRPLSAGIDTASWTVRAPDLPATALALRLLATATDLQSGASVAETCAVLLLDVVQPAGAQVAGALTAPASARDQGQVYPDATVTVRGWLRPTGQAALAGSCALQLQLPAGHALAAGWPAVAVLDAPTDTATWRVQAPSVPGTGVDALTLRLASLPRDANSGLEVGDPSDVLVLPLATVQSLVRLRVGDAPSAGPIVGTQQLDARMLLQLENGSPAPVRWTRIDVTVVDASGTALPDPAGTLAEVALLDDASGTVLQSQPAAANPVALVPGVVATAGQTVTVRLAVRAAGSGAFVPFALRVGAGGLSAEALDATPVALQLADLDGIPRASVTSAVAVLAPATLAASGHSYPNPFVPSRQPAVIAYTLPAASAVEIGIYDLLGGLVRSWRFDGADPQASAGVHDGDVIWDGTNGRGQPVRSGVYVCRIRGSGQESIIRIAVTR